MKKQVRSDKVEKKVEAFDKLMLNRILTSKAALARRIRKFGRDEMANLKAVLKRGELNFAEDGMINRFERAFAKWVGAEAALARSSGMTGLAEAISVSGATCATEVIVDPVVHFGAIAAAYFNAVPRFADIDYNTYTMSPAALEANITQQTRAVIVTHLWGLCADIAKIRAICRRHKLFLIEDCAHAMGSYWNGQHAGTFGDVGVFSFQESKQLSTGDGGMVVCGRPLAEYMKSVSFSGESPKFICLNWRMNETTAAVGLAQLAKVKGRLETIYNKTLAIMNEAINGCPWLKKRHVPPEAVQAGYWFACSWEGDQYGLDYARFKKLCFKKGVQLAFGFNQAAPYEFAVFKRPNLYNHPDCPIRCPFYTKISDYHYQTGLCPNVERLMPRLATMSLIFVPVEQAKQQADLLRSVIHEMER